VEQHEGDRFPAVVRRHVIGAQFHPEKSLLPGVRFVRVFAPRACATADVLSEVR
jgi:imidazoleglycerol phosphate synthase glutamine amidotransferase subunit HisH